MKAMARGWESKSVESQIDAASTKPVRPLAPLLSDSDRERLQRRKHLALSRTRVLSEITRCTNSRFHDQLTCELTFLENELKKLETN